MTKRLEYIASGCSYTRLQRTENTENEELRSYFSGMIASVSAGSTHHKFGLLFNAFTEKAFGPKFRKYDGYDSIHADSGGLQIITQGKTITPALKDDVYRVQAKSADMGMCFDEIPVGTTGVTSGRNDVSNRWFRADEVEVLARETGKNIRRQIEVFQEEGSSCRPIIIAQGNCYDTYMTWVDNIMKEIPSSMHKHLGAIAMGGAALGTGPLEDIERAFIYSQLPVDKDHLHVLGVGSARRMLPYLVFMQSGLYGDSTVSYDSTTHTSGVELGLFTQKKGNNLSLKSANRQLSKEHEIILAEMQSYYDVPITPQQFADVLNSGYTVYVDNGGDPFRFTSTRTAYTFSSIRNFVGHVDRIYSSKDTLLDFAQTQDLYMQMKHLYNVKTKADFDVWMKNFSRTLKSNRISATKPSSLEDLFA